MTGQQLKNSILQEAIEGRLVPQDPNDEPASVLLERIRAEKARLVKEKKIKIKLILKLSNHCSLQITQLNNQLIVIDLTTSSRIHRLRFQNMHHHMLLH